MTSVLLVCGPCTDEQTRNYDQILALGVLQAHRLAAQGITAATLFDIPLPDQDAEMRVRIEEGLARLAALGGDLAWSTLAFQHVYWRYIRYLQYRQRLACLVKRAMPANLTLSSGDDGDLLQAARTVCASSGVGMQVLDQRADGPSSLLSFLASYDLPVGVSALEAITARLLALHYRQKKVRLFYQPYNNIGDSYQDAAVLTWRRSISFPAGALPVEELGHPRSGVNLDTYIHGLPSVEFPAQAWPGFDEADRKVLACAYSYFHRRYPAKLLSRLQSRASTFLRTSRASRLVLNSDNTCTTRLLAGAARQASMQVDYLPHGLIWEDLSLKTGSGNSADRVLAWNESSAQVYRRHGADATVITHPSNEAAVLPKRRFPADLSTLRVLLMPPEWVGLSFAGRPDCFERDVLDVLRALHELGISRVHLKCHHSIPPVVQAKLDMLEAIRPYAPIAFEVVDSRIRSQELYEQFDLCIIGPTTGLLEASRSSTPFIAFRALLHKAGIFNGVDFPAADSVDGLVLLIRNYDFERIEAACQNIALSLTTGASPFSPSLDFPQ